MPHKLLTTTALALLAFISAAIAQPAQSPFSTRKIDGTDNVYLFRYQGHQSMFIVTPKGVIATDPIGRYRPEAVTAYLAEIKKVTDQPVKYLVYSHAHFDHALDACALTRFSPRCVIISAGSMSAIRGKADIPTQGRYVRL
jgi:glyoxylase-like metal-dependent hydrolase (beta-lactamase superfamily II)